MLGWLADWLKSIIAVVLLASFIDLLLPNRSMQRYVRLVASLIILLTILSPIISLLKGDFDARLDDRFASWLDPVQTKAVRMPTLQDIQHDAEEMRSKQQAAAAILTERKLAEAMSLQIKRQTGVEVVDVAVVLATQGGGDADRMEGAYIAKVTVTLAAKEKPGSELRRMESERGAGPAVVEPVTVSVELDEMPQELGSEAGSEIETDADAETDAALDAGSSERYVKVEGEVADAIRGMLQDGWFVVPETVLIREEKQLNGH